MILLPLLQASIERKCFSLNEIFGTSSSPWKFVEQLDCPKLQLEVLNQHLGCASQLLISRASVVLLPIHHARPVSPKEHCSYSSLEWPPPALTKILHTCLQCRACASWNFFKRNPNIELARMCCHSLSFLTPFYSCFIDAYSFKQLLPFNLIHIYPRGYYWGSSPSLKVIFGNFISVLL